MIRRSAGLFAIIAMFGAGVALAANDPIKERKDLMKGNGQSLKGAAAMIKGEVAFDAAAAAKAMSDIDNSVATFVTLFPKGTETGGDTAAKPAIWDNRAEFESLAKDMEAAAQKAAGAASEGIASFRTAFGAVGKACKACHEKFRAEKQ